MHARVPSPIRAAERREVRRQRRFAPGPNLVVDGPDRYVVIGSSEDLLLACGHLESDLCECEEDGSLAECEAEIEAFYRARVNGLTVGWVTPSAPPGLRAMADELAQAGLSEMIDDPHHWEQLCEQYFTLMNGASG